MIQFDIEAIRSEVRAMAFARGTPEQVAQWKEDSEDTRADASYPLSAKSALGLRSERVMSMPQQRLSAASPPVRWNASGRPRASATQ